MTSFFILLKYSVYSIVVQVKELRNDYRFRSNLIFGPSSALNLMMAFMAKVRTLLVHLTMEMWLSHGKIWLV